MMKQLFGAIVMVVLVATFLLSTLGGPRPLHWPADRPEMLAVGTAAKP